MTLILDIETLPLASALTEPYPKADRFPPSNYKKEEAIQGWYERDEKEWREGRAKQCALNPRLGRVVCLGWEWDPCDPQALVASGEAEERGLLCSFWNHARVAYDQAETVVTWNGQSFDLRFLLARSWANDVEPSVPGQEIGKWMRRYYTHPHFDVFRVLTNWDTKIDGETLEAWAQFFGVGHLISGSGADVQGWCEAGDFESIAQHCRGDVAATAAIYRKIAPSFSDVRQIGAAA